MRITHLDIGGFGAWSGLRVEGLGEGLNVLYGPNEAGKTTLLQFVRSMFYGFTGKRRGYLPPLHGGDGGGVLGVHDDSGRYFIERFDRSGGDELAIHSADGMRHGEHMLKALLANIDEPTFNNIFAVGLREMQELGSLSDVDAASMLYGLTVGVDRVALLDVMRALEQSRSRILDQHGKPCQLAQLLAEQDAIRGELEELGSIGQRYGRIAAERHDLDAEIVRLEEECHRAEHQSHLAETAMNLRERWQKRALIEEQLAAFGAHVVMPAGAIDRYEAISEKLQGVQRLADDLRGQQDELRLEIDTLEVNEALARQSARIEALAEQEPWLANLQGQVLRLNDEIAGLEGSLAAELKRLGLGDGMENRLPNLSGRLRSALRAPERALRETRRRSTEAEQSLMEAEAAAAQLEEHFQKAMAAQGQTDLSSAIEKTGALVAQLRRCCQTEDRVEQMARYQEDLEQQSKRLLHHQLLPMPVIGGLAAVFALGVTLFLVGIFLPGTITGNLGLTLAVIGIVGSGAAAGGKILLDRSNARQLENIRGQLAMLATQLRQSRDEAEALGAKLGLSGATAAARLDAVQKDLAALEELVPMESRRTAARQQVEAAARRAEQSRADCAAARKHWSAALRSAGLPKELRPRQLRRIFTRREQLAEWRRTLEKRREELGQRSRELKALCARIDQAVADSGVKLAGEPAAKLRELGAMLVRQEAAISQRKTLRDKLKRLRRREAALAEKAGRMKRRRKGILLECGTEDEEEFRLRAAEANRFDALRKERLSVERDIEAAIAGRYSLESLRALLEGGASAQLHQRLEDLAHRAATLQGELKQRLEKSGRLAEQLSTLASDNRLAIKRFELAAAEKRLEESVRRWQVQAVACRALEDIRMTYEHERQPETLQEASKYLERLTEGRYQRVWTPLGEAVLKVEEATGHSLLVENLSRGTREQLFLSLRLSLASWYARHGASLPLVLDDVLVNFDAARMRAAAETLNDYAAGGRQLLVLTCHEHMFQLFSELNAPTARLPSNAGPGPHAVRFQQHGANSEQDANKTTERRNVEESARAPRKRTTPRKRPAAPVVEEAAEPQEEAAPENVAAEESETVALAPLRASRQGKKKKAKKKSSPRSTSPKGVFDADYFEAEAEEEQPPFDFEFEDPEEEDEEQEEYLFDEEEADEELDDLDGDDWEDEENNEEER